MKLTGSSFALALFSMLTSVLCTSSLKAQEMYDASTPSEGQVLRETPKPFLITFSEAIHLENIRLVGADGSAKPTDWKKIEDDVFKVEFNPTEPLAPGKYSIEWTAYVRQHYHSDGGVINFSLDPATN